ncbi:glycosyltransferase involved in cell wall biosynthesis [Clostridium acetobutylicum]|uniref:Glycosyltransferase n=1 Tax=Clostridium acetobutylicum (strain ATCC 824 / DSM 792 / JCM 1419 / IAM 19013 / LMG 5710 / NBRC 13948 / NRRL B-527 / VKM B-1787 / 2291 / W) TaxID=272562 RepID=Q97EQ7_CLOAB|nr:MULTISPECIES: glycosyltransferase [Clostridium]AAK80991.1 Glycosyltransferase [Clostridium acetobutylicum ATCC 824]ADZ22094.1 Glycosyltransferase [Clostridium acetobutylicum EA 2018]AEI32668.1 glycosyltransferase [Clostridium acetobutylicum DSM 1731]AWV78598.1 glycosyltransferase [Clostridium acetobutylicum]MBC2393458.1 glycosyltransferase [Clostridium acetobutylicum]
MKILIITPSCPYPPHKSGGALIIYNLLKQNKSVGNTIDLLYYDEYDKEAEKEIRKYADSVYNKNLRVRISPLDRMLSILKGIPYGLYQYKHSLLKSYCYELQKNHYDVVFFDQFSSVLFQDMINCTNKIFFECDCVSLFFHRKYKMGQKNLIGKVYNGLQYKYYKKIEKNYYKKFNKVFFVSESDALYVKDNFKESAANIDHINLGVNIENFDSDKYDNLDLKEKSIVFTGIMNYAPNKDAVLYFYNKILPEIIKKYPDIKFYIVGKNPDSDVQSLEGKNVVVTGFVDDIAEYIAKASVYVSPLNYGTGMKNKVLEAMSMNKAIVASEVSVEGINELKDGVNIFIAKDDKQWIDKILLLLSNDSVRKDIGANGRNIVKSYYSWEKAYMKLFSR